MNEKEYISELRELLTESAERITSSDSAILLSGGLDTSILASIIASINNEVPAFTVVTDGGTDLEYAQKIAEKFDVEHHVIRVSQKELFDRIPEVIKSLGSFDPAIPNDLAIYMGLIKAKRNGVKNIITGDAADELFAGYNYMQNLHRADLVDYTRYLSQNMSFSSNRLGHKLGIDIKQPFRDEKVVEFSLNLEPEMKVKRVGNRTWGKWILRKAYEEELGELSWREKAPIEYGSGTTGLRELIRNEIPDEVFEDRKRLYRMEFINKEHLYFYEVYRRFVGEVKKADKGENKCPGCGAGVKGYHCGICGYAYPIEDIRW
ncbi:MAG: asparagine synthase C-terminal domain-containing protein [Halobacteriota archaeon]